MVFRRETSRFFPNAGVHTFQTGCIHGQTRCLYGQTRYPGDSTDFLVSTLEASGVIRCVPACTGMSGGTIKVLILFYTFTDRTTDHPRLVFQANPCYLRHYLVNTLESFGVIRREPAGTSMSGEKKINLFNSSSRSSRMEIDPYSSL